MATFYVLHDNMAGTYVRAGRYNLCTYSLNNAKHFTSIWSAECFMKRHSNEPTLWGFKPLKIVRQ